MLPLDITTHKHLEIDQNADKFCLKRWKCWTWKGSVRLKEFLTAKVDLHCHRSDFSLPTSAILYAIHTQAVFTSTLHSRHHWDRTSCLPLCLLESISSPPSCSHLPRRCINMKKATQAPRTLWSSVVSAFVWQHNSLPCEKAYPMHRQLEVTLTPVTQFKASSVWLFDSWLTHSLPGRDKCCWENNVDPLWLFLGRTFSE